MVIFHNRFAYTVAQNPVLTSNLNLSLSGKGHTDELWGLDIHPTKNWFVTCGQDKLVHVWDATSHRPLWSKYIEVQSRLIVNFRSSFTS